VLGYLILPIVSLCSGSQKASTRRCRLLIQRSFRMFIWFMSSTGVLTFEVHGRAALFPSGQLLIANHPTLIDVVFLIALTPNATCIVKSELYRNIFTRGTLTRAGYIANDSPEGLIDECTKAINSGSTLLIFPEGTRSVNGRPGQFKRGAAYVLLSAKCPLVTVTIKSSPPTLAKGEKWYNIPARRPHFELSAEQAEFRSIALQEQPPNARELTRAWHEYFDREIKK
jgi:1-acyl-sn-glycerol-3-phosphate acyltransferase